MKKFKALPKFKDEEEERTFWAKSDSTEYFDMGKLAVAEFPNLKPSTQTMTIRLPKSLLNGLKIMANKRDVPYQSLVKIILADKVREETAKYN